MFPDAPPMSRRLLGLPVAAAVVAVPLLVLLATLWPSLHFPWVERSTYSHGYLVLAISLYLVYREFRSGPPSALQPSWLGLAVLGGLIVVSAGARAADVGLVAQLAIPAIALSAVWAVAGSATAKRYWLPAAYVVFAIPLWDSINELLRGLTVSVVGWITRQSSIPAFIDGNVIHIPSGTFVIEDGCSGLHYLIVACALGVLYGVLTFERWPPRFYALGVAIALALIANWIRVFVIIVAGYATDMQHFLVTVDHYYFGWALFFVVFAPLLLFGARLEALAPPRPRPPPARVGTAPQRPASSHNAHLAVAAGLLLAGAWLSAFATSRPEAPAERLTVALPAAIGSWVRDGDWEGPSRPRFAGADAEGTGRYGHGMGHVSVFVARYLVQQQGKEVVFYSNRPSGESGEVVARSTVRVELADGQPVSVGELEVVDVGGARRVVWYGYEVAGARTADAVRAKLYQVLGAFRGRWDARVIVVSAVCEQDCARARESLGLVVAQGYESLSASAAEDVPE